MLLFQRIQRRWLSNPALVEQIDSLGKHRAITSTKQSIQVLKMNKEWASQSQLLELETMFETQADIFEKDLSKAKEIARKIRTFKERLNLLNDLEKDFQSALELSDMAEELKDPDASLESYKDLLEIAERARTIELQSLLRGPVDHFGCILEVSSGSGGTEAMDFAGMLFKMYESWAMSRGFNFDIKEYNEGPVAGIRSSVVAIESAYAYGWMKGEHGPVRICRVSPHDAAQRRHTSFAQVAVFPLDFTDSQEQAVEIKDSDLRIDTFRSSGPGGQSVNTTASAVRIVHIPTGITVQSQNERSQHRNKATCLKILGSRLLAMQLKAKEEAQAKLRSTMVEASFGSQIRTYYFNPQKFVKDHRSNFEIHDTMGVLSGEKLQPFMEAYLQWEATKNKE